MTNENKQQIGLRKVPTGVRGLDEITYGGLPTGRVTLIWGGVGCGKTLTALEFLVRGATDFNEPGVMFAFEETATELMENTATMGFDLKGLIDSGRLAIEGGGMRPGMIEGSGGFTLDGLLIRLNQAIERVGAKRVVLDTLDVLFASLPDAKGLRDELHRLCLWLRERGLTVVLTAERDEQTVIRWGFEEYVADCVIVLDHRVDTQLSTRRMRIVKYRGSAHGTNEYPFLIDHQGVCVMPITSAGLIHEAAEERVSTGVPDLDAMLGGPGLYRGGTALVSGTPGCGKTSLSAHFVRAACARGERCIVFLFEESPQQWLRNMRSIGQDLKPAVDAGLLIFSAARPTLRGLEMHLAVMTKMVADFEPHAVVIDPISSFDVVGDALDVKTMLVRLVDHLKLRGTTVLMTCLTHAGASPEQSEQEISSIVDTWIFLRDVESSGERNRCVYILKSRGMAHSNQVREFRLSDHGISLVDVYIGDGALLTGSARLAQAAREREAEEEAQQQIERKQLALKRKRALLETRIEAMRAEFAAEEALLTRMLDMDREREAHHHMDLQELAERRGIA